MKELLIKQSKNSFIRCTERYGYITNQLTRHDRSYDSVGAVFLSQITRKARPITEIVDALGQIFEEAEKSELKNDFIEFAESLAGDKFGQGGQKVGYNPLAGRALPRDSAFNNVA